MKKPNGWYVADMLTKAGCGVLGGATVWFYANKTWYVFGQLIFVGALLLICGYVWLALIEAKLE